MGIDLYTKIGAFLYGSANAYNPVTGANDNGLEIRGRLKYAQQVGMVLSDGTVHKNGIYAAVNPQNLNELLFAIKYGEAVPLGVAVNSANEQEYREATPYVWDAVGADEGEDHCVAAVGRPDTLHETILSWKRRGLITEAYRSERCFEAWFYLDADRISKVTKKEYAGPSEALLAEYIAIVAKEPA